MDNRRISGWTINKEISVGDLIAIVLATVGILGAYYSLDKRTAIVEAAQITQSATQSTTDMRQDVMHRQDISDIKESQIRMEVKVDKLLEKSSSRE